jgi:hypothetical protein
MSVHASKVEITNLSLDDRWRSRSVEKRKNVSEAETKTKGESK